MADNDNDITDKDVRDTLKAAGIDPVNVPAPRALSSADDIAETLRQAGISASVSDKGVNLQGGGFQDTPDQRAAIRQRKAWLPKTPQGPGFPPIEPPQEVKDLADRRGLTAQVASSMPIAGPLLDRGGAAGAALFQDEPGTTFAERYGRNLQMERDADKWYASQNPKSSFAANVGGAALGTAPLAMTKIGGRLLGTTGATIGSRLWTGVPGNAGMNALDAYLRGENPIAGGEIGAAGGFAGPVIGAAARGVGQLGSNYLWPRMGALANMSPTAINKLTAAMEGETPASIAAGRSRMGPSGFLGDVTPGLTDLAGGIADTPGPGKAIVREAYRVRDAGARTRIGDAIDDAAGKPIDPEAWKSMTMEARKKAADPLYKQFRDTVIDPTDEIQALVPRLKKAGAFTKAEELAGITGEPINMKFLGPDGSKIASPTAQTWDYVKRGLDSRISASYEAGDKTTGNALVQLKNELLDEIDKSPGGDIYKKARNAFAEHSALLDQFHAGRDTFLGSRAGMSKYELAQELKGLSGPERQARIMGMRDAVSEGMGDRFNGDTTTRNKLLAPNNQDKMKLMIGDQKGSKLVDALQQEKFLKEQSQNIAHGSQTTPKKERVDSLAMTPMPEWNLIATEPTSWLPPSWINTMRPSHALEAERAVRHESAMNQLAHVITTPEGPKMNDLIIAIMQEAARQSRVSGVANALGNVVGGAVAGPTTSVVRRRRALGEDNRR